jgi:hypothetical protein
MADRDPVLRALDVFVHTAAASAFLADTLARVRQQLERSDGPMAWDVVPLDSFGAGLPADIRSCWIFVIRAGAATTAERHPNSHQRSYSLIGSGTFELHDGMDWRPADDRWVSIPPSTWHRLRVGPAAWGMVSFHTVAAGDLIEEKPVDATHLDGPTHQERYTGRG